MAWRVVERKIGRAGGVKQRRLRLIAPTTIQPELYGSNPGSPPTPPQPVLPAWLPSAGSNPALAGRDQAPVNHRPAEHQRRGVPAVVRVGAVLLAHADRLGLLPGRRPQVGQGFLHLVRTGLFPGRPRPPEASAHAEVGEGSQHLQAGRPDQADRAARHGDRARRASSRS